MEKFIPYGKLSKKKKRELDARKRASWGAISPVTRKSANPKAYDRKKARRWKDDLPPCVPFLLIGYACGRGPHPSAALRLPPSPTGKAFFSLRFARIKYACGRGPHPSAASRLPPSPEGKA